MLVGRSKTLLTTYQPACFEKFLRPYSEFLHPCENLNCEIEGLDSVIGGGGIQLLSVACFSQKKKKKQVAAGTTLTVSACSLGRY